MKGRIHRGVFPLGAAIAWVVITLGAVQENSSISSNYFERMDVRSYRVRLVSYERILPVWEGIIRIPTDAAVANSASMMSLLF